MRTPDVNQDEIFALGAAAANAGDEQMVKICARAMSGDLKARAICEKVIADTRAQED